LSLPVLPPSPPRFSLPPSSLFLAPPLLDLLDLADSLWPPLSFPELLVDFDVLDPRSRWRQSSGPVPPPLSLPVLPPSPPRFSLPPSSLFLAPPLLDLLDLADSLWPPLSFPELLLDFEALDPRARSSGTVTSSNRRRRHAFLQSFFSSRQSSDDDDEDEDEDEDEDDHGSRTSPPQHTERLLQYSHFFTSYSPSTRYSQILISLPFFEPSHLRRHDRSFVPPPRAR